MAVGYDVKWHGKQVFMLATEANVRAMNVAANLVERETKKALSHRGSFKSYKRTKSGKIHWSSQPGSPPAPDSGLLRTSIMSDVRIVGVGVEGRVGPDIDKIAAAAEAGTDVDYGLYLEIGTRKMAARPFLRPTLRKLKRQIDKIFIRANR